jgi:hypothetical protein
LRELVQFAAGRAQVQMASQIDASSAECARLRTVVDAQRAEIDRLRGEAERVGAAMSDLRDVTAMLSINGTGSATSGSSSSRSGTPLAGAGNGVSDSNSAGGGGGGGNDWGQQLADDGAPQDFADGVGNDDGPGPIPARAGRMPTAEEQSSAAREALDIIEARTRQELAAATRAELARQELATRSVSGDPDALDENAINETERLRHVEVARRRLSAEDATSATALAAEDGGSFNGSTDVSTTIAGASNRPQPAGAAVVDTPTVHRQQHPQRGKRQRAEVPQQQLIKLVGPGEANGHAVQLEHPGQLAVRDPRPGDASPLRPQHIGKIWDRESPRGGGGGGGGSGGAARGPGNSAAGPGNPRALRREAPDAVQANFHHHQQQPGLMAGQRERPKQQQQQPKQQQQQYQQQQSQQPKQHQQQSQQQQHQQSQQPKQQQQQQHQQQQQQQYRHPQQQQQQGRQSLGGGVRQSLGGGPAYPGAPWGAGQAPYGLVPQPQFGSRAPSPIPGQFGSRAPSPIPGQFSSRGPSPVPGQSFANYGGAFGPRRSFG